MNELWVFDLDGTLVDSFGCYFELLEKIFEEHGSRFTPEHREPALTVPLHQFFARELGSGALPKAFARLQSESEADAARIPAYGGAREALQWLSDQGARRAVWTNRDLVSAQMILDASGLAPLVEAVVSGTCVEKRKPDAEGMRNLLVRFGIPPERVTMVGDHEHDVTAGQKSGARTVRASWHGHWEIGPCEKADHQFHRFEDFALWLRSASGRIKP